MEADLAEREGDYRNRRLNRVLSPDRVDAFALGEMTPHRAYTDHMREIALQREKEETMRLIGKKKKEEEEAAKHQKDSVPPPPPPSSSNRRNRWDLSKKAKAESSDWDLPDTAPGIGRWDAPTQGRVSDATPSAGRLTDSDSTPGGGGGGGVTPGVLGLD